MTDARATSLPPMRVANAALDDPQALADIWEESGYWYFRQVLDKDAVANVRAAMMQALKAINLVDADSVEPIWNGHSQGKSPFGGSDELSRILTERRVWQNFVARPEINAFFERVLGCPVVWLPIAYYRAMEPTRVPVDDPVAGRHQDGVGVIDVPFLTCWIPLADVDDNNGGLAVAEGCHRQGLIPHQLSVLPRFPIEDAPADRWRRGNYEVGDIVMFRRTLPHSGLPNYSDRLRLSIDIRVMKSTDHLPTFGRVIRIEPASIAVRTDDGAEETFVLDENTWCRAYEETRLSIADMIAAIPAGTQVMLTHRDGHATLVRPQIY